MLLPPSLLFDVFEALLFVLSKKSWRIDIVEIEQLVVCCQQILYGETDSNLCQLVSDGSPEQQVEIS